MTPRASTNTSRDREPTEDLRLGRRTLEEIEGWHLVEDLRWHEAESGWALLLELRRDDDLEHVDVPRTTRWYALLDHDYPRGRISVHPASVGGISVTFPHQDFNGPGSGGRPWRDGRLCLDEPIAALDRLHPALEPTPAADRLAWHVRRAGEWLAGALRGDLLQHGDAFELPDFDGDGRNGHLVHAEDEARQSIWSGCPVRAGLVQLHAVTLHEQRMVVASEFFADGGGVVANTRWGNGMRLEQATRMRGGWILLPAAPIVSPWQAPQTWGQLRACARAMEVDLDVLIEGALKPLAGAAAPILLVGFPIPAKVGGDAVEIHWQPLLMPAVPSRAQHRGRRSPQGAKRSAPVSLVASLWLRDDLSLRWGKSENWSPARLGARGRLRPQLRDRSVAIIGVGALGSVIAELLIRGGVSSLTIVDGERLAAGNLVRHTLGISDIADKKAKAVARRLLEASPHVVVKSFDACVPGDIEGLTALLGDVDVVVDCTADDGVLELLGRVDSGRDRRWISTSLGYGGRRLYVFDADGRRFPTDRFRGEIQHWIRGESMEIQERELPREGPGCWHPLFPARYDAIMMMAALAVNEIDARVPSEVELGRLRVIHAEFDEAGRLVKVGPEHLPPGVSP
jgi:hypothetical protein